MAPAKSSLVLVFVLIAGAMIDTLTARPRRILVDTDLDVDDVFALIYLLKQNRSEFDVQAITISANGWSDAGHAVNYLYDILFSMDRDDIPVGVGGEGGISPNGTIDANVGGYLPIIDQGMTTAGGCRYRQAIPPGQVGGLYINTNYGLRRKFLPQGARKYTPLRQATAQQVIEAAVSRGPITVILMGSHTNFALFLMTNPILKKNVEQIFVMGGAIESDCPKGEPFDPRKCSPIGNIYPQDTNPYAEFNIFADPFAAYKVLHSGIPVTLVPLDATRSVPVDKNFYMEFERRQRTFEAHYCFQSLKMIRNTWPNNGFHEEYCLWDSFMVGVALSIMRNGGSHNGENEFAEMEYKNITVVTSDKPYGLLDGSNPLVDGLMVPRFNISKRGVHGGHVQTGMQDPFCIAKKQQEKCKDGYTEEVHGEEAVQVLVATKAKPSKDAKSSIKREFYENFLNVVNHPHQSGRFSIREQLSYQDDVVSKGFPKITPVGKLVVFDMDMSPGDFLALLYLLKAPEDAINLKAILVSSTGWATAATIDLVYDALHMMGRDDIPVGLGEVFAVGQRNPSYSFIGDCQYRKTIPHGSGGFLDSDTLYGLAGFLPRSPRRYTAENSVHFGAPRDTDNPQLRQPLALDVWNSVVESLQPGAKVTILTNGPLTNLAQILNMENSSSVIQDVFIVGAHIGDNNEQGNLFTIPSNEHAEFNMFLDPLAAKAVFDSQLNITIIPLSTQRRVSSFRGMLHELEFSRRTPEAKLARLLLRRLWLLQQHHHRYHHMDIFLGEILGAVTVAKFNSHLKETFENSSINIVADGNESEIGRTVIDEEKGRPVRILKSIDESLYYEHFAKVLGLGSSSTKQSYRANGIATGNWSGGKGLVMYLKASCSLLPVQLGVFLFFLSINIMVFARTRL